MPSSFDRRMQRRAAAAGRLLELFVLAPIGAGVKLVSDGPAVIARARQELSNARFIGEMVIGQGATQLKERLDLTPEPEPVAAAAETTADAPDPAVVEPAPTDSEPLVADELAIPDYDSLPAIDIVGQLDSLSADELIVVEAYERANRRRRTVLGKVAQLSAEA